MNVRCSLYRKQCRAVTMVEVVILLGIMGIVLGSLWTASRYVMRNVRKEQFAEQLTVVVNNMRSFYQNQAGIKGTETAVMQTIISNNVLPREMRTSADTAVHPWGDSFSVSPENSANTTTYQQRFKITLSGLDQPSCLSVLYYLADSGAPRNLVGIKVNGTALTLPLPNLATLETRCVAAGSTVDVIYQLRAP